MNRIQSITAALVTLLAAAATPACVAGPVDSEESDDTLSEDVGSAQQASALPPKYMLDNSYYGMRPSLVGDWVSDSEVKLCDIFTSGVVRSWQLKEKNNRDFRFSREWCRPMMGNGQLGTDNDFIDHFYYDGDGTLGMSSIPLDKLPVGVRYQGKYVQELMDMPFKISDVALMYESAADILAQKSGYSLAPYALGRTDDTYTHRCWPGYVMTGIGIHERHSAGSDSSEMTGLKINCALLVYQ
jgi:hypothetical protein